MENKLEKGALYVVGTPIGNLSDFSPRAAETLAAVDFIAAADTRVTVKLLNHFGIKTPLVLSLIHISGLFLLACGAVLALRAAYIPAAVQTMVREAFSLRAVGGGAVGMATAMRVGVSRGVFTNEAGLGSGTRCV